MRKGKKVLGRRGNVHEKKEKGETEFEEEEMVE